MNRNNVDSSVNIIRNDIENNNLSSFNMFTSGDSSIATIRSEQSAMGRISTFAFPPTGLTRIEGYQAPTMSADYTQKRYVDEQDGVLQGQIDILSALGSYVGTGVYDPIPTNVS